MTSALRLPLCLVTVMLAIGAGANADDNARLHIVSSAPEMVSGGDALVEVRPGAGADWSVRLNGRDVTAAFQRTQTTNGLRAQLQDLKPGRNSVELREGGKITSRMSLVNHARSGPIFSGPHQMPFACETTQNGLGPARDAACSAETVVSYYYRTTEPVQLTYQALEEAGLAAALNPDPRALPPGFKAYPTSGARPDDIAQLTLPDGTVVDYVVRRELGVINRGIYEIKFLHTPGTPLPSPWTGPTPGWNGRLVYRFDGGCGTGHRQGVLLGWAARRGTDDLLEQGYALATSTLNIARVTCNHEVSAETAAMVTETFTEQFGKPALTIGSGQSGGALLLLLGVQNHPGVFDGLIVDGAARDLSVLQRRNECTLLTRALEASRSAWSDAEKTAVTGLATWRLCRIPAFGYNPQACPSTVPKALIYDRVSNPKGLRCTYFENAVSAFGRDPATGFAYRPFDNVGVQYGLTAFNAGKINAEQFVDLNERVGGFDVDGQPIPARSPAPAAAIKRAYDGGGVLTGHGFGDLPIIDWVDYGDDLGDGHTRDSAFIMRARLIAANGHADNHVVLTMPRRLMVLQNIDDIPGTTQSALMPLMDRWLTAVAADASDAPARVKVPRHRPPDLADGCILSGGEKIAEPVGLDAALRCNQAYPVNANPRRVSGEPLAGNVLKCALKPVDPADYAQPLSASQVDRLKAVFPHGVCNYAAH